MAVRITTGGLGTKFISRDPGGLVGVGINTFALGKIRGKIKGRKILPIILKAIKTHAYPQAKEEWPIETGASGDTIRVQAVEVGENVARGGLVVGGQPLIDDERNKKHIDYAPFIEFNGSPAGRGRGTITNSMYGNVNEMIEDIREGVAQLITTDSEGEMNAGE